MLGEGFGSGEGLGVTNCSEKTKAVTRIVKVNFTYVPLNNASSTYI